MRLDRKAVVFAAGISASAAVSQAALTGDATVSGSPIGGGLYHYTVTLHNTGTTTVGTLWFAWIPGGNFMSAVPTNITSPAGWNAQTVGGAGAVSILWQANNGASRLAAGGTLATFAFDSANTPAQLAGFAASSPTNHVTTSYLYIGAALTDPGFQFTASVVPTPAALSLVAAAPLVLRRSRRAVG